MDLVDEISTCIDDWDLKSVQGFIETHPEVDYTQFFDEAIQTDPQIVEALMKASNVDDLTPFLNDENLGNMAKYGVASMVPFLMQATHNKLPRLMTTYVVDMSEGNLDSLEEPDAPTHMKNEIYKVCSQL